MIKSGRISGSF